MRENVDLPPYKPRSSEGAEADTGSVRVKVESADKSTKVLDSFDNLDNGFACTCSLTKKGLIPPQRHVERVCWEETKGTNMARPSRSPCEPFANLSIPLFNSFAQYVSNPFSLTLLPNVPGDRHVSGP